MSRLTTPRNGSDTTALLTADEEESVVDERGEVTTRTGWSALVQQPPDVVVEGLPLDVPRLERRHQVGAQPVEGQTAPVAVLQVPPEGVDALVVRLRRPPPGPPAPPPPPPGRPGGGGGEPG